MGFNLGFKGLRLQTHTHTHTHTHSGCVILNTFQLQQWLHERVPMLRYVMRKLPVLLDYYERCVTSAVMKVEWKALHKKTVQGTERQTKLLFVSTGQL